MPSKPLSLPDRLAPGLDIVSIGINPSVYSAILGFNFARSSNRFWSTLNAAGLVPDHLDPGKASVMKLLRLYRIGFTDIVKRATDRASELTDEDYRKGALLLRRKLLRYQPKIAWFQGKDAYRRYVQFTLDTKRKVECGRQPERIADTVIFVSPNPSGANPAANPKALLPWYIHLRRLRDELTGGICKSS